MMHMEDALELAAVPLAPGMCALVDPLRGAGRMFTSPDVLVSASLSPAGEDSPAPSPVAIGTGAAGAACGDHISLPPAVIALSPFSVADGAENMTDHKTMFARTQIRLVELGTRPPALGTLAADVCPDLSMRGLSSVVITLVDPCTYQKSEDNWPKETLSLDKSKHFLKHAMGSNFDEVPNAYACFEKKSDLVETNKLISDAPDTLSVVVMTYCTPQLLSDFKERVCRMMPDCLGQKPAFLLVCSKWDKLEGAFCSLRSALHGMRQTGRLVFPESKSPASLLAFVWMSHTRDLEVLSGGSVSESLLGGTFGAKTRVRTWA